MPKPKSEPSLLTKKQERLYVDNADLAVRIAKKYKTRSETKLSLGELALEGLLGLVRAARHFNPATAKCSFTAYAADWVRQGVRRAIEDSSPRPPGHYFRLCHQ